jgi:hypothetical protein
MTTIVIDDKKKGAKQMLDLLKELDFVSCVETVPEKNIAPLKRKNSEKQSAISQSRGMWKDYDIDLKHNRMQTYSRRTKTAG